MLDELQIASGIDIPDETFGLTIHQPKIKEIAMLGEQNYFLALQMMKFNKDTLKITTPGATDWDVFQKVLGEKIDGIKNTRALIRNFMQLFVIGHLNIGPRSLMIETGSEIKNIEPEQLRDFQALLAQVGGASLLQESDKDDFHAKSKRAKEIAEKMKKARAKIAKMKAAELNLDQNSHKGFLARYMKVAEIGTANSIEDINNMTLLQLNNLVQAYYAWESYDLDIRARLAGSKNDKQLIHWSMADEVHQSGFETI